MVLFLINLITAIFIGLKLSNVIAWSWLIVLSPTLFLIGLGIISLFIGYVVYVVMIALEEYSKDKRRRELKNLWGEYISKESDS